MQVEAVRTALGRAAEQRSAAALVATRDGVVEVSVAPGGRWVARSHDLEWMGAPDRLDCWQVLGAGARQVGHAKPAGWIHPAVGMLWPELLPIWGRSGDSHAPSQVIVGAQGPGQLVLEATGERVGGLPLNSGGWLDLDAARWLCLQLDLAGRIWTVQEYCS